MEIRKNDLIRLLNILSKEIEKRYPDNIELTEDFYWDIDVNDSYNPLKQPEEILLGQLTFDWEELERILENESDSIGYDLKRISEILKYLYFNGREIW